MFIKYIRVTQGCATKQEASSFNSMNDHIKQKNNRQGLTSCILSTFSQLSQVLIFQYSQNKLLILIQILQKETGSIWRVGNLQIATDHTQNCWNRTSCAIKINKTSTVILQYERQGSSVRTHDYSKSSQDIYDQLNAHIKEQETQRSVGVKGMGTIFLKGKCLAGPVDYIKMGPSLWQKQIRPALLSTFFQKQPILLH